jgi:hypothetical protein
MVPFDRIKIDKSIIDYIDFETKKLLLSKSDRLIGQGAHGGYYGRRRGNKGAGGFS